MVKLTKEDENKLGQILKELNKMKDVLKGGEGSGVRGHKTSSNIDIDRDLMPYNKREKLIIERNRKKTKARLEHERGDY